MALADDIRQFVHAHYIAPARAQGRSTVAVTSGDVHKRMGLRSRMPAVCSALRAAAFQTEYGVKLVADEGPHQGSTVRLVFAIGSSAPASGARRSAARAEVDQRPITQTPQVTADDLARWRRKLLRILGALGESASLEAGPASRVRRLAQAGRIPRELAPLMLAILESRNVAEYEQKLPSATHGATLRNAWDAILEWAKMQDLSIE